MSSTIGTSLDYADLGQEQTYNGPMPTSVRNTGNYGFNTASNESIGQGPNINSVPENKYINNGTQESNINHAPTEMNAINNIGLRDKIDQGAGLMRSNVQEIQQITTEFMYVVDTRDCIGQQSLLDAQYVARTKGIRPAGSGLVTDTSSTGVFPMVITVTNIDELRNGDYITIKGIVGNTNANGQFYIQNVTPTSGGSGTFEVLKTANASYYSGGEWTRVQDPGYPMETDTSSIIRGNELIANIPTMMRELRTLSLFDINIPRDIIPLEAYITDFVKVSTTYDERVYEGTTETNFETFIKEEPVYTRARMIGFFSSPLDLWRAYIDGNISMPDSTTPAPLELWNPPGPGAWPLQPVSYPYQTVPTYRSGSFTVPGADGLFRVILAGYGVVDLLDWTYSAGFPEVNALTTSIMRKLLLILICPKQSYRDVDYVSLILASDTVDPGNLVYPFGYGNYQRFLCAPGLSMGGYQPGTNVAYPENPTIVNADSPIPFPNFNGNVFGPYSKPGDRFQSLGVRTTIQDLYLNGDLNNLHGTSPIFGHVPVEGIASHPTYGLNFLSLIEVNLENISSASNPNIVNAMRIVPNGFGTANVRANGGGTVYINKYTPTSGGMGPSLMGQPSTWSDQGLYNPGGTLNDPIAKGPANGDFGPELASATTNINDITKVTAFYDLGPNNGQFVNNIQKYINYAVNDIPDNDLIIQCYEINSERGMRSLSTNNVNGPALIDASIRLSIGSSNGTQQYIESIFARISMCESFWTTRYMNNKSRLEKLHLYFFTYDQIPIPLEKMLQPRRTNNLLLLLNRLSEQLNITAFEPSFLYDTLNPKLINRMKRYFQIRFKAVCYEASAPGLAPASRIGVAPYVSKNFQGSNYT